MSNSTLYKSSFDKPYHGLPNEVLSGIIAYALYAPEGFIITADTCPISGTRAPRFFCSTFSTIALGLLRTSRKTYELASSMLCEDNVFRLELDTNQATQFLLAENLKGKIRHLYFPESFLCNDPDWRQNDNNSDSHLCKILTKEYALKSVTFENPWHVTSENLWQSRLSNDRNHGHLNREVADAFQRGHFTEVRYTTPLIGNPKFRCFSMDHKALILWFLPNDTHPVTGRNLFYEPITFLQYQGTFDDEIPFNWDLEKIAQEAAPRRSHEEQIKINLAKFAAGANQTWRDAGYSLTREDCRPEEQGMFTLVVRRTQREEKDEI